MRRLASSVPLERSSAARAMHRGEFRRGSDVLVEDAGVDDALDARGLRGADRVAVLRDALLLRTVSGDQYETLDACKRGGEGLGTVEVAVADLDTAPGQRLRLGGIAHADGEQGGGAGLEPRGEMIDDGAAQEAVRSGDENHGCLLFVNG